MDQKIRICRTRELLGVLVIVVAWGSWAGAQPEESPPVEPIPSARPTRSATPILDRFEAATKNLFGILPLPALGGGRGQGSNFQKSSPYSEPSPPPTHQTEGTLRNPAVEIYRSPAPAESSASESFPVRKSSSEPQPSVGPASSEPKIRVRVPESTPQDSSSEKDEWMQSEVFQRKGSPWNLPLHERLRIFRESGFAGAGVGRSEVPLPTPASSPQPNSSPPDGPSTSTSSIRRSPSFFLPGKRGILGSPLEGSSAATQEPTLAPPRSRGAAGTTLEEFGLGPRSPLGVSSAGSARAQQLKEASPQPMEGSARPSTVGRAFSPSASSHRELKTEASSSKLSGPSSIPGRSASPEESDSLLMVRQSPMLSIQTHGPRRITVGKEAPYEVVIQNSGSVAANDLVVTIDLPGWAEVLSAEASVGSTQVPTNSEQTGQFLWRIGRLEPRAREKLILRIVPRESRPFELGVRWSFTPQRSQAEIEVQEPKLGLQLEGPRDVIHGQRQVYKLIMTNTGNGPAENVVVSLLSKGAGEQVSASHKLGTLAPGEKKVLEVELIPRSPGQLILEAHLQGDGNAQASLSETITVRKPELRLSLTGPTEHFVGVPAIYRLQVSNPGNAPAKNVQLLLQLPEALEQILLSPEGRLSIDRRKAEWHFPQIAPGASKEISVKCQYRAAGLSRISAKATADADLAATDSLSTQVEAVADLTLSVIDPPGPVPVGEEAVYELRIHNRGTKTATQVEVVAYFSYGIEPVAAEGALNRIGPGQVVFSPIAAIAPGQTHVLKVKAKAERAGNHIFRAEVYCRSAGVRLVSEGTTRYFGNPGDQRVQLAQPGRSSAAGQPSVRTAERSASPSSEIPPAAPSRKN